jgi:hypothetical protein
MMMMMTFFYNSWAMSLFLRISISYSVLGWWYDIIVLNIHAPTENKTDDVKDSFHGESQCVFNKFLKYHMKILLGDFKAKVVREDIFKLKTGNKNLHEICNDNGVGLVTFASAKNLLKVQCSHNTTLINILGYLLMGKLTIRLTIFL